MPLLKSPGSLLELTVENVAQSMGSFWCKHYKESLKAQNPGIFRYIDGPFNRLNSEIVGMILRKLPLYGIITKTHLDLLIVPHLKEIDFKGMNSAVNDEIIELICSRCTGLKTLRLDQCNRVSSKTLFQLIKAFHDTLFYISISSLKISPGLLKFIGCKCVNLRALRIDMCKVSRSNVEEFFFSDKSKCLVSPAAKNLYAIHMNGCSFTGDVEVLANVLKLCPHIKCMTHFSIWEGIAQLCEDYSCQSELQLEGHKGDMPLSLGSLRERSDILLRLPGFVPHLTHLCISDVQGMGIPLVQLITGCGTHLKSLTLEWEYSCDLVRYIGACCINLVSLSLDITGLPSQDIEPTYLHHTMKLAFEEHLHSDNLKSDIAAWSKLERLSMCFATRPTWLPVHFISSLSNILGQAKNTLSCLTLTQMTNLAIGSLLEVLLFNAECFQSLKRLNLSGAKDITSKIIWEVIMVAPMLKELVIADCTYFPVCDRANLIRMIKKNNYDIKVSWTCDGDD